MIDQRPNNLMQSEVEKPDSYVREIYLTSLQNDKDSQIITHF